MRTKLLYDFETEQVYITSELHNGDWAYRLAIRVMDLADYGDFEYRYDVSILAVSPEAAGVTKEKAYEELGIDTDYNIPLVEYEYLISYGAYAVLWIANGNNLRKLLKEARSQLPLIRGLFGFFMDRHQNRIGSTGWDFIAGDIMAGLDRWRAENASI